MEQTILREAVVSAKKLKPAAKQPFPVSKNIPNAETIRAIEEAMTSKNLRSFKSVAEMKVYLKQSVEADE